MPEGWVKDLRNGSERKEPHSEVGLQQQKEQTFERGVRG